MDEGELAGAIYRDVELELAFGSTDLGDIDVKIADRIDLEFLLRFFVADDLRQPADAMSLQSAMER